MNGDHLSLGFFFCFLKLKNVMSPSSCIITPLRAKVVTKVVDPTSTSSHYSRSSGYDCHILSFVDAEVKECFEHVCDKE